MSQTIGCDIVTYCIVNEIWWLRKTDTFFIILSRKQPDLARKQLDLARRRQNFTIP